MVLIEFRIPLPLSVSEFHRGQLAMVAQKALMLLEAGEAAAAAGGKAGAGEAVEWIRNEPYDNRDGHWGVSPITGVAVPRNAGQYTLKRFHVKSKLPAVGEEEEEEVEGARGGARGRARARFPGVCGRADVCGSVARRGAAPTAAATFITVPLLPSPRSRGAGADVGDVYPRGELERVRRHAAALCAAFAGGCRRRAPTASPPFSSLACIAQVPALPHRPRLGLPVGGKGACAHCAPRARTPPPPPSPSASFCADRLSSPRARRRSSASTSRRCTCPTTRAA